MTPSFTIVVPGTEGSNRSRKRCRHDIFCNICRGLKLSLPTCQYILLKMRYTHISMAPPACCQTHRARTTAAVKGSLRSRRQVATTMKNNLTSDQALISSSSDTACFLMCQHSIRTHLFRGSICFPAGPWWPEAELVAHFYFFLQNAVES